MIDSIAYGKRLLVVMMLGAMALSFSAEAREKMSFNQGWLFDWGEHQEALQNDFDDSQWYGVNLPHTVRFEPVDVSGGRNYQGKSTYRKSFTLPRKFSGKRVTIEFEAAMHEAEVWLNGKKIGHHFGGYLPFFVDVSDCEMDGRTTNVLVVKLDNSNNPMIPPGTLQNAIDFCYFGGIYRDAWLHVTEPLYITNANEEDIVAVVECLSNMKMSARSLPTFWFRPISAIKTKFQWNVL